MVLAWSSCWLQNTQLLVLTRCATQVKRFIRSVSLHSKATAPKYDIPETPALDLTTISSKGDAKTGELLGAHMIGAEVTELIQGYVIGRSLETTEEDLMNTVFPHPTLSEMMHEAVLDAYGRALHI